MWKKLTDHVSCPWDALHEPRQKLNETGRSWERSLAQGPGFTRLKISQNSQLCCWHCLDGAYITSVVFLHLWREKCQHEAVCSALTPCEPGEVRYKEELTGWTGTSVIHTELAVSVLCNCLYQPCTCLITSLLHKQCSHTPNHPKPHMTKVSFATKLKPPQFTLLWSFNYIDPWHYQVCILFLLAGRPSWWPEGVWLYLCTYLHSTLFFITKRQLDGMPKFTKRWNPRKSESKTVPKEGKRQLQCSSRNSNSLISAFPSSTQTYNHNSREEKKST